MMRLALVRLALALVSVIAAQPHEPQQQQQPAHAEGGADGGRTWRQIPHLAISKNQLVNFYSVVDPSKIVHVDEFVSRFAQQAPLLHDQLMAKYPQHAELVPVPSKEAQADYFKVLELERGATPQDVRARYRELSLEFHPDKAPPGSSDRERALRRANWDAVTRAHGVLSDDLQRRKWESEHPDPAQQQHHHGAGGAPGQGGGQQEQPPPKLHVRLSHANYDTEVERDSKWLFLFTMNQCSFCDELEAAWDEAAEKLQYDGIKLGVVNCESDGPLCDKHFVQQVPFVKLLLSEERHAEVFRGEYRSPQREATLPSIIAFAQRAVRLQSKIEPVSGLAEFKDTVLGSADFWVVFFGQREHCPLCEGGYALLRHLSASMRAVARVGRVDCDEAFQVCAYALNKGNIDGFVLGSNKLPKFMLYRAAPLAASASAANASWTDDDVRAESAAHARAVKGFGESLLPRAFASENELYGAVTVMEKAVRLANAHLVAQDAVRPFESEEDRKFGEKQEAERAKQQEEQQQQQQAPPEPPKPPMTVYHEEYADPVHMIGQ